MKRIYIIAVIFLAIIIFCIYKQDPNQDCPTGSCESYLDSVVKAQCYQYEAQKVIPAKSCYCASKLFNGWGESYDWKDACAILKEKNRINPTGEE